ncbi:UTP--glucose-1-phosphate uridylyltransferase GalU [Acinetobacter seifertii]|uniref:UTP--glucose-1-phosphate uridylyltransferase n=1 Tax=Acinetobacter seifertii TaxID=1530123 RepID=A0ABX8L1Q6_9GAMM|nr:UTP--glucose-1-phosphate uridylyltransferase GalU [Acinetobacter seifertii]
MIKKAVLPVAGLGTRFLPASKSIPKEMVTVVDRPAIEYVVREAVEAGIEQIIFVTHSAKVAIEDYFDHDFELETILKQKQKFDLIKEITNILPSNVSIVSVRQPQPLGLGHAVLCAKSVIGNDDFAVLLPDVLVKDNSEKNDLSHMVARYAESKAAQIMVEAVADHLVDQYGIVDVSKIPDIGESIAIQGIIEKPAIGAAPSNLSVVGRYILPAKIMQILENIPKGASSEIQLTDAIAMLQQFDRVEAYRMQGETFDCGSKLGYLKGLCCTKLFLRASSAI